MARAVKEATVAELTERFQSSSGAVLTEYRGLTVAQVKELRQSLGEHATFSVVKNTLTKIAAKDAGPEQQAQAENVLTGALRQLFALSEAYPDLKANQNFLALQEELTSTEDRIAYARQFYNDSVMKYDNKIQSIPSNIIAGMFGFKSREYFQAEEGATEVPKVQF